MVCSCYMARQICVGGIVLFSRTGTKIQFRGTINENVNYMQVNWSECNLEAMKMGTKG